MRIGFLEGKRPLRRFLLLPWEKGSVDPSVVVSGLSALPEYVLLYVGGEDGVVSALVAHEDIRDQVIPLIPRGAVVPLEQAVKNANRLPVLKEAVEAYRFGVWVATETRVGAHIAPLGPPTAKFVVAASMNISGVTSIMSPLAEMISSKLSRNGGGVVAISARISEKAAEEVKKFRKKAERRIRGIPAGDVSAQVEAALAEEKLKEANFDVRIAAYGPAARQVLETMKGISALRSMSISSFKLRDRDTWEDEEYRLIAGTRGKPLRMGAQELALFWPYLRPERNAGNLIRLATFAARSGTIPSHPGGIHILDVLTDMGDVVELRIPAEEFTTHFFHFARTGAGKTTLAVYLLAQLAAQGHKIFFIDPNEKAALMLPSVLSEMGVDPEDEVVIFDPAYYPARFNAVEAARYPSLDIHIPHVRDLILKALNIVERSVIREITSWIPYREALSASIKIAYELNEKPTLVHIMEAFEDVLNADNEGILSLLPADLASQVNSIRARYASEDRAKRTEKAKSEMSIILTKLTEILGWREVMASLCSLDHSDEGGKSPILFDELFSKVRVVAWGLPFYLHQDIRDPLMRFLFGSFWLWMLYRSMRSSQKDLVLIALDELHVLVDAYHEQLNEIITMVRKYGGGLLGFTQDPTQMEGKTEDAKMSHLRELSLSQPNVIVFGQMNVLTGEDIPLSDREKELVPTLPDYHSLVRYARVQLTFAGKNPNPAKMDPKIAPGTPGFQRLMEGYASEWGANPEDVDRLLERMRIPAHERSSKPYTKPPVMDRDVLAAAVIEAMRGNGVVYVPTRSSGRRVREFLENLVLTGALPDPPRVYIDQGKAARFWSKVSRSLSRSSVRVVRSEAEALLR